ncbi:MAG: bacillithiol biosynthesis cysteine-adding enzyme BshC [Ignavibacteria bacterium]|nr:bacillithiol biosynthesis cysteine-adding enzyme BshC [Ignavibacteria bacterium]
MYQAEFGRLPNFNSLFLDYVSEIEENYLRAKKYFSSGFRTDEDFSKVINDKKINYNSERFFDKSQLIEILKRQNVEFGGDEITAENIEKLKRENTFAVVAGQQTAIYTGPLYTILKSITAIKLAKELSSKFKDYCFVPVFWMESEDHDFEEASHVYVINKENDLVRIGYEIIQDVEHKRNLKPVGSIILGEVINSINQQLKSALLETEFRDKIINIISGIYREDTDFKTAFARLMNEILKSGGLIFIDPSDPEIKKLLTPVFEKELRTHPQVCEKVISVSDDIEKVYDLQVKPKVINLYYIHNGNRLLIEPREEGKFALRNSKKRFEAGELEKSLEENPELFSPNVILRPICQDYLLPTVSYVGGPAEISYLAQLKKVYQHYNITMPVIFPRASVTILENKISKFMDRFGLKFEDIFHREFLISKVVEKISEIKIDDEISKYQDEINKIFYDIKNITNEIDKTLVKSAENLKEKFIASLDYFRQKLINAQARKSEITTLQIDKVCNNIFPNDNLQERVLNIFYFINKYDTTFVNRLFDEIQIHNFNHQVIEMN